jgi:GntR family transcriptional regulator/MocR family aminotransferase
MWDSGASALDQAALARFIETGAYERHIRRMRRVYRARRDAMITALDAEFGDTISIGERHGGLNVLVRFHEGREDAIIAQALTAGVALRSVREYFTATPADPTFLIGFGIVTPELAPAAVRALRTVFSGPAV